MVSANERDEWEGGERQLNGKGSRGNVPVLGALECPLGEWNCDDTRALDPKGGSVEGEKGSRCAPVMSCNKKKETHHGSSILGHNPITQGD